MLRRFASFLPVLLVIGLLAPPARAAYPGANGIIAFERGGDIWVVEADGSNPRNVTNTPTNVEQHPVVSPDGTRIAYTRTEIYDEIWTTTIDGTQVTEVSNPIGHDVLGSAEQPTWSPDGTEIAFQGFHDGEGQFVLWVADANGGGGFPLTTGYRTEQADWGVNNEIVVRVAGDFYAVDANTGAERILIRYEDAPDGPESIDDPEWSPDGTRIVFTCDTGLCSASATGTDWQRLTDVGVNTHPQYSPDGRWIIYAGTGPGTSSGDYDIWRVPVDGVAAGQPERVTSGPATDRFPDWGPAGGGATPPPAPTPPGPTPPGPVEPPVVAFDDDPATTAVIERGEPVGAAIEIARARFADAGGFAQSGPRAQWVVLSRDDTFPDSLAGAALTAGGPMLFTNSQALTASTHAEIQRVLGGQGAVFLLGGTGAISVAIESQLRTEGYDVQRLAGPSRVETALAVATEVRARFADNGTVLIARASGPADNPTAGWADSVSGGAIAAYGGVPIVITPTDAIHPAVAAWLQSDAPTRSVLLGGIAALSAAIEQGVPGPIRVAGDDRTATAAAIAEQLWPDEEGREFVVVNGFRPDGWAFGLAAAGIASDAEAPVVIVGDQVSPATAAMVSACGSPAVDLLLVGDSSIIGRGVADELDRLDGGGCGGGTGGGSEGETPPPGNGGGGGAGQVGRWAAEPFSLVAELEFDYDGSSIRDVDGTLLWYCDGSSSSTYITFYPEGQPIQVTGGSWSVDNEYDDGQGNTYREVWTGTFTSATTVEGTISYSVAGNGSYCQTGTVEWSGAPA
ncbi:hypothetical protein DVS28_a0422 [Euzebya pacifica]|uniref:WD40-like Beta Propeller Repeat n=1 Tax=Euzebya pacifica TaxID=1608957 RepID=A0A346XSD2_9ACTN|nr:cell wall-binding repeat-containing protein [Euzebya pacifica]AXV05129.1 hypothetical protein DVS28_a0422 [Euzebya pacifica]